MMARARFTDWMSSVARVPSLLHGVQLFLDVLRGPVPAHAARGGFRSRGQDHEMVLPARLGRPRRVRRRLRRRAGKRRRAEHAVRLSFIPSTLCLLGELVLLFAFICHHIRSLFVKCMLRSNACFACGNKKTLLVF